MTSPALKALALIALLTVVTPALAEPATPSTPADSENVRSVEAHGTGDEPNDLDRTPADRHLSTLGVLMLGVLSLLWMRRHTAES